MKKIKLAFVAMIAILFLVIGNVNAQEQPTKTVIIRTLEYIGGGGIDPELITVDAEGNINSIKLEKGKNSIGQNTVLIQKEIERWKQQGYKITHLSTSGESMRYTTIILEK